MGWDLLSVLSGQGHICKFCVLLQFSKPFANILVFALFHKNNKYKIIFELWKYIYELIGYLGGQPISVP